MKGKLIYGIQQVGIGVRNAEEAFRWYATHLGADISVFDDNNTATYMAPYMGGEARRKRAILAVNLQGGSGYEIWQYLDREPTAPTQPIQMGDLGINSIKIKSRDVAASYARMQRSGIQLLSDLVPDLDGQLTFYLKDPYDNLLQVKGFNSWYKNGKHDVGGIFGATLGVADIEKALLLYRDILGYNQIIYDQTGTFDGLDRISGGKGKFRRVLLGHDKNRTGGFSPLFGDSQLELIQVQDRTPVKIFADRYWGDLGFIHLCFDIRNMEALVEECRRKGFPFQVLSAPSFDMGDANGHWGYIEDADGTLIEFVETHKVPLIKKINWSINLKKRDPLKPVPNWLINAMSFNRVKF